VISHFDHGGELLPHGKAVQRGAMTLVERHRDLAYYARGIQAIFAQKGGTYA
jgi:hypothetical protein